MTPAAPTSTKPVRRPEVAGEAEIVSALGEPVWELALHFPRQGEWTEADYLELEQAGLRVELVDGRLEFLPMPVLRHQRIAQFLFALIQAYLDSQQLDAEAVMAPCPVRLGPGHVREPDVFVVEPKSGRDPDVMVESATLAIEVVSGQLRDRRRDLEEKRVDYARAGVSEYWIIDPQLQTLTVLMLRDGGYEVHGEFAGEQAVTSVRYPGLACVAEQVFRAGDGK